MKPINIILLLISAISFPWVLQDDPKTGVTVFMFALMLNLYSMSKHKGGVVVKSGLKIQRHTYLFNQK